MNGVGGHSNRAVALLLVACSSAGMVAQSQPPAALEVASVVPNQSGPAAGQRVMMQPGGTIVVTNFPVRPLVQMAFRVQPSQLIGGPEWLRTDRFDITARSSSPSMTPEAFSAVLGAVLTERFKLRVSRETRELPVYTLVTARADGAPGPGLRRVPAGCGSPQANPTELPRCNMNNPPGRVTGSGITIAMLAFGIGSNFDRVLVDRTGLAGWFDVQLEWAASLGDATAVGPTLVTALQEQLGLKVDTSRAPVEVVVIDSIEKPAAN